MNPRYSFLISILAAAWIGLMGGEYLAKGNCSSPTKYHADPNLDMTNEQYRRVTQGYVRDHATHRWFKLYEAEHDDGCKPSSSSSVIDVTFVGCRIPLTGGLPDFPN